MHCIALLGLWGMHCIALLGLWGMHCFALLGLRGMHCIAHRSCGGYTALPCWVYGVCSVLHIGAMGYSLHCPSELWAMHCIALLGLWGMHCIALLGLWGMHCIALLGLWGMHCIYHRSFGVCTALPIGAMGYAWH